MMKKAIAALVILATLVGTSASFAATSDAPVFSDVSVSHWAYSSILAMSEKGIMQGQGGSTFNPEGTLSRAEFIAVVTRAMIPNKIDATIKDTWYAANYKAAIDSGLVLEDEMPNEVASMGTNITRYEMARILVRADENINGNGIVASNVTGIKDYVDIPNQYRYDVSQAYAKGLLAGYGDGTFSGEQNMSRAQAAVVMERLLNTKVEVPVEPTIPPTPPEAPDTGTPEPPEDTNRPDVMPEVGEYTAEYQAYLDNCGEDIVTKTVNFKMFEMGTQNPIPNTTMTVWRRDWEAKDDTFFVMTIRSDANGKGAFTLDMPKSLYEKTMRGADGTPLCDQFIVYGITRLWEDSTGGNAIDATVDGATYSAMSGQLKHYYLRATNPLVLDLMFAKI